MRGTPFPRLAFTCDIETIEISLTSIVDPACSFADKRDAKSAKLTRHQIPILGKWPFPYVEIGAVVPDDSLGAAWLKVDVDGYERICTIFETVADEIGDDLIEAELEIGCQRFFNAAFNERSVEPGIQSCHVGGPGLKIDVTCELH